MGLSFGGWLAAELAVKAGRRIDRLVLVDALGIKVSDRETPDILDVFKHAPGRGQPAKLARPRQVGAQLRRLDDEQLVVRSRNWDALCLTAGSRTCTILDSSGGCVTSRARRSSSGGLRRIVKPSYGEAYAKLIPGARFELIRRGRSLPEIEQAQAFVDLVGAFLRP